MSQPDVGQRLDSPGEHAVITHSHLISTSILARTRWDAPDDDWLLARSCSPEPVMFRQAIQT